MRSPDPEAVFAECRIAPMNTDERVTDERRLRQATLQGYVAADRNYDSNKRRATYEQQAALQRIARPDTAPAPRSQPKRSQPKQSQSTGRATTFRRQLIPKD